MKVYSLIFIAVLTLGLAGCSGEQKFLDGDPSDRLKVVTDLSKCQGRPIPTSVQGNWRAAMVSETLRVTMNFEFYQNEVRLTNVCETDGVALSVSVTSRYHNYGRQLRILDNRSDERRYNDGTTRFNCSAQITAGISQYSFRGRCLKLKSPGAEELILIPVD